MIPSIEQEIRDLHALLGSAEDPEGRAFVPLADAYRRAGDPDRALELLGRGLERHPDLAAGYLMQALACRDLADDAGAESAYRRVLSLDGDNARALVGLGRLMRSGGQEDEAARLIQRGAALDPRLASEGTPDRVPRHSTNPEVVGAEALAPLEWEVIEPPVVEPEVVEVEAVEPEVAEVAEPEIAEPEVTEVEAESEPEAEAESEPATAEWESGGEADDVVSDQEEPTAEVEARPVEATEVSPVGAEEPGPETIELSDAEAAPLRTPEPAVDLGAAVDEPVDELAGTPEALDIEWEVEDFYRPIAATSADETAPPEASTESMDSPDSQLPEDAGERGVETLPAAGSDDVAEVVVAEVVVDELAADELVAEELVAEELVVDAWSLAPDGWQPEADALVAAPDVTDPLEEGDGIPVDLSDLAPEPVVESVVEPVGGPDDDFALSEEDVEEPALPTRTLGDLYAQQGLTTEAIQVFRDLVESEPTNLEHRARLLELEAELAGGGRKRAGVEVEGGVTGAPDADDPPISGFFDALLGWESGDSSTGES